MITILFQMLVKDGLEGEFTDVAREMMLRTRAHDEGCVNYVITRQVDEPRRFVLFEQWRDQASMNAHLGRLMGEIGQERFAGFFESTSATRLEALD